MPMSDYGRTASLGEWPDRVESRLSAEGGKQTFGDTTRTAAFDRKRSVWFKGSDYKPTSS